MADVDISYNGSTIATMSDTGTKTLETQGKYCTGDIVVSYTKPAPEEVAEKDVNFIDYDGTIRYSYTASEFANLTELPANPSHTGLTAQGWNWSLSDAKTYVAANGKLWIGQMCITDDGKTRIYIRLEAGRLSPYLGFGLNGTAVINWGDGSTEDTVTGSSVAAADSIRTQHTYTNPGDYVISISVTTGSIEFTGDSTNGSYLLLAGTTASNDDTFYRSAVQKVEIGSGINALGSSSMGNLRALETITLPNTLNNIGNSGRTFYSDVSLKSCVIPQGLAKIATFTFAECSSLVSISIPISVTDMTGASIFKRCRALRSVSLPPNASSINATCESCFALLDAVIGQSVTKINGYFAADCHSLKKVVIPSLVTSISGSNNFYNCLSIHEIHFKPTTPPTVANSNSFALGSGNRFCRIYVPYSEDHSILNAYKAATNYPDPTIYTYIEE